MSSIATWWAGNVPEFFWKPVTTVNARVRQGSSGMLYVRSYMAMRTIIGVLGILLPIMVIFGARYWFDETDQFPRTSISDYYYSGAREFFVDSLAATGVFFIAYKVFEANVENFLSILAGLAAITITIFPTGQDAFEQCTTPNNPNCVPLNAVQKAFGMSNVSYVHYGASVVFLVSLTLISACFGYREGNRPQAQSQTFPPIVWAIFHLACTALMAGALIWVLVETVLVSNGWKYSLLAGEIVCSAAFGASWLVKGFEINPLIHGKP